MKKAIMCVIGFLVCSLQLFSEPLTKEKVLEMVEAKVDTELIVSLIVRDCVDFDVDADLLIAWSEKVDKHIVKAIIECRNMHSVSPMPAPKKPTPFSPPAPQKVQTIKKPATIKTPGTPASPGSPDSPDTPEDVPVLPFSQTLPQTMYFMEFKAPWIPEDANVLEVTFYKDRIVCLPCKYTYGTWSGELKSKTEFDPYTVDFSDVQECYQKNREIVLKTKNGDVILDMKARKGLNDQVVVDLCDRWLTRVGRRPSRGDFPSVDYAEEQLQHELMTLIMHHQIKTKLQHP